MSDNNVSPTDPFANRERMRAGAQMGGALVAPEVNMPSVIPGFFSLQGFELMQRVAKGFAASTLVPKEYQGNIANCMIALNMAQRINADPLMVMQNLVVVHGRPTWSAQFLIATANMCGRFTAIRFEFFGERNADSWGCRAWATEKGTSERLVGSEVTIGLAKKEGWYSKNGSKWQSMPQQMLMYRSGAWWVRAYAPELSMGLMTTDEAGDVFDARRTPSGAFEVQTTEEIGQVVESTVVEQSQAETLQQSATQQQATAQPATEQSSQPETRAQPAAADDEFGDMNTGD